MEIAKHAKGAIMGVGISEWQQLNSNRGKFYTEPQKSSSRTDTTMIDFPLFGTDPFDTGVTATTTVNDVATNAAISAWDRANTLDVSGNTVQAEKMKQQVVDHNKEAVINALGYQYLNNNYTAIAADIFKRNVTAHPGSWNTYDSLADAQARMGDAVSSLGNYNKAISLAPDQATKDAITTRMKQRIKF